MRCPDVLPDTLTDGVTGCLSGPTKIADEFEFQDTGTLVEVVLKECESGFRVPGFPAPCFGSGKSAVDTNIEDHSCGTHPLCIQHAQVISWVIKVAQFAHEFFGIQCPTFAMTRDPQPIATPRVELVCVEDCGGNLEVVSGNTFVTDGGLLLPGGERIFPFRH